MHHGHGYTTEYGTPKLVIGLAIAVAVIFVSLVAVYAFVGHKCASMAKDTVKAEQQEPMPEGAVKEIVVKENVVNESMIEEMIVNENMVEEIILT